ncbi:unnamed protein product [Protopolystoma xenopodis]|uniref:Uncharacterized protein n=1 Tax=Protopolystoma xenopodis TaxID=117903 RepID=A0A3S5A551_9PLAT|nr:unnamed protein product [Protopolystoma xenopodis]
MKRAALPGAKSKAPGHLGPRRRRRSTKERVMTGQSLSQVSPSPFHIPTHLFHIPMLPRWRPNCSLVLHIFPILKLQLPWSISAHAKAQADAHADRAHWRWRAVRETGSDPQNPGETREETFLPEEKKGLRGLSIVGA